MISSTYNYNKSTAVKSIGLDNTDISIELQSNSNDLINESELELEEDQLIPNPNINPSIDTDTDIDIDKINIKSNNNNNTNTTTDINTSTTIIQCLCFNLTSLPSITRFLLLSIGVFIFFLLNSWVEEYTFKQLPEFQYGWYLTLFELLSFSLFAIIERLIKLIHNYNSRSILSISIIESIYQLINHNADYKQHLIVSISMTASRGLTNISLQYLSVPTQIVFKSMKLLTVMIGSLFLLNNKFTIGEYLSALTLVISVCCFSFADNNNNNQSTINTSLFDSNLFLTGIIIVLLSLIADSIHSNTQESLLKQYNATTDEVMLFTNLFSSIFTLIIILFSGELYNAIEYCNNYPIAYKLFFFRSIVVYLGVLCFITLIKSNGIVISTTVTTIRKILSIFLSFILFPKPFNYIHGLGVFIFSISVSIAIYDSKQKQKQKNIYPN